MHADDGGAPGKSRAPEWSRMVAASLKHSGLWETWENLRQTVRTNPSDLSVRGYLEIVRATIVREMLGRDAGLDSAPELTATFQSSYDRFDLTAQEGFLVSLIDGRLTTSQLLKVTPLDHFTTLFLLSKLEHLEVIAFP